MQRVLYRLGCSKFVEQFLLKGALLFWVWNEDFHRPTRDIDLLTYTDNDVEHLLDVFQQVIMSEAEDGLIFDAGSLKGIEIKEDADYSGVRITGFAGLTNARVLSRLILVTVMSLYLPLKKQRFLLFLIYRNQY
jgi:hypothetical protein